MRHKAMSMLVGVTLATLVPLALPAGTAAAEPVLQRINRTGKLTAGTRTESIPFAYLNDKKEWVGFSVDLIKEIQGRLEHNLAKKIKLELKAVTPENRFEMVADGTVDLECGSTTYTRSRDETVDFSINFFYSSGQLLIKADGPIKAPKDISGKRIGVARGTTTEKIIRTKLPQVNVVRTTARGSRPFSRARSMPMPVMGSSSRASPSRAPMQRTLQSWGASASSPTPASCRKTTRSGGISSTTPSWN